MRLAEIRSAGVTDLRFGHVLDEHWKGHDRFAPRGDVRQRLSLPEGVKCYAIAATTASRQTERPPGDGLVPVASALGRHARPELTLGFPQENQSIAWGRNHLDLLNQPEVYSTLRSWLSS